VSAYDERPWLARYGDQPADYELEFDDALAMFRAGVARDPSAVALQYFDGAITNCGTFCRYTASRSPAANPEASSPAA
jgi:hypothetical protein